MPQPQLSARPRSLIRSCEFCRSRKVRCDGKKPTCQTCLNHKKSCVYKSAVPSPRPTKAAVNALQNENRKLLALIRQLKNAATADDLWIALHSASGPGQNQEPCAALSPPTSSCTSPHAQNRYPIKEDTSEFVQVVPDPPILDTSPYFSVDESGNLNSFGPSSAWQMITDSPTAPQNTKKANIQNTLVANAALTRQSEYRMASLADLDGVPIDLANHLLDLHWNRQHHTFLLTYRPEITRGILENGEFGSKFLLNSIFACASKFSTRPEVRESGPRFFRRCEEIMSTENLLLHPSLPTIVGLLLLGSTFVARGVTTKGWLLTGYALRMVYDLGLHIDRKGAENDIIESEVRKRIFWGAFVCDKLQSLYLGRPFAIKLRDAHVSLELNDIMEEHELWTPYDDQKAESAGDTMRFPTYSVSCFQRLCLLSKIMTRIIDEFYVVGATVLSAQSSLRSIDDLLRQWEINLPEGLRLGPERDASPTFRHAPNVLCLHIIHNALIILLHRPLVADGHLRSASPPAVSWKRCSEAAERITLIVSSYRCLYTLRGAPYLISYGLYVACTIHVRNNGATTNEIASENKSILERSVRWLEELAVPNPAVSRTVCIIRKLMEARGVRLEPEAEPIGIISGEETSCITESNRENEFNCDGVVAGMNSWNDPQFLVNEWDESFSDDLLYGFMDQQVPFDDPIPEFDIGSLGQI